MKIDRRRFTKSLALAAGALAYPRNRGGRGAKFAKVSVLMVTG
jgi:hypothetical protein